LAQSLTRLTVADLHFWKKALYSASRLLGIRGFLAGPAPLKKRSERVECKLMLADFSRPSHLAPRIPLLKLRFP
jgi:hypothetical protein